MQTLEAQIDKLFDENPILKLPFPHIYNFFCQIVMRQFLDDKEIPHSTIIPFTFVFEKVKDFSPQTLESCTESAYIIQREDFRDLFACANLNIVFPFIHSGIYNFSRKDEQTSLIDYFDKATEDHELHEIMLTQLSLPSITRLQRSPKTIFKKILSNLKHEKTFDPEDYLEYISSMYSESQDAFVEAEIIPESFYTHIGFSSSEEFKKIRIAFICLGQTYIDVSIVTDKYLTANALHDTSSGKYIWQGLAMAKIKHHKLRSLIQHLTSVSNADYDKFYEFFFCGAGKNSNLSNKFMPPFWHIEDDIYYFPAIVPTLLSARNVVIAIQNDKQKNKKYSYDSMISKLFEPELLKRAARHFESVELITCSEVIYKGGEIDLLVYCQKSHTILTIQAKATLYPESARMAKRLDGRVFEAVDQTVRFDSLDKSSRDKVFMRALPDIVNIESVQHLRGVLTNSGFGTTASWQLLKNNDIIPLNCNILKNTLPKCSSLKELPEKVDKYIGALKDKFKVVAEQKIFRLPGHTVYQRHLEPLNMKNLHEEYWGENIGQ